MECRNEEYFVKWLPVLTAKVTYCCPPNVLKNFFFFKIQYLHWTFKFLCGSMVRYYGNGVDLRALLTRIRPIGIKWSAKSSRYEKPDDSTDVNGFEEALMFLNFCFVPFIWFLFCCPLSTLCLAVAIFRNIFPRNIESLKCSNRKRNSWKCWPFPNWFITCCRIVETNALLYSVRHRYSGGCNWTWHL